MASFLSAAQKANIDSVLDRLHDTFATTIYIYTERGESDSQDSDYNALYDRELNQSRSSLDTILTKEECLARVKYAGNQMESQTDANLNESFGQVRIKVTADVYEKIKIASKIEIDDILYRVIGDPAIVGMFSDNYYTIFLKREN
jgi:ribosomal protein S24E